VVESEDFLDDIAFQYGVGKGLAPETTVGTANLGPPPFGALPVAAPPCTNESVGGNLGPHGAGMHMVERMRLIDPETLESQLTVYDDTVWKKPYVMSPRHYVRIRGPRHWAVQGDPEEISAQYPSPTLTRRQTPTWIKTPKKWSKCWTVTASDVS